MTLWHLVWMHVAILLIIVLLIALLFAWHYAFDYAEVERFKRQRVHFFLFRQAHAKDGLPCTTGWWVHGELVELKPGLTVCRRCGWRVPT